MCESRWVGGWDWRGMGYVKRVIRGVLRHHVHWARVLDTCGGCDGEGRAPLLDWEGGEGVMEKEVDDGQMWVRSALVAAEG